MWASKGSSPSRHRSPAPARVPAAPAAVPRTHHALDPVLHRNDVEDFLDGLPDLVQPLAAAGADVALDINHDIDARQMLRKLPRLRRAGRLPRPSAPSGGAPPVTSSLAAARAACAVMVKRDSCPGSSVSERAPKIVRWYWTESSGACRSPGPQRRVGRSPHHARPKACCISPTTLQAVTTAPTRFVGAMPDRKANHS
jgi:hypothetical protein